MHRSHSHLWPVPLLRRNLTHREISTHVVHVLWWSLPPTLHRDDNLAQVARLVTWLRGRRATTDRKIERKWRNGETVVAHAWQRSSCCIFTHLASPAVGFMRVPYSNAQ